MSESHIGKLIFVVMMMIVFVGLGVFVAWLGVNDLPGDEHGTAWAWFAAGWVLTTAIAFGAYLPGFVTDRIVPQTRRQQAENMAMAKRVGIAATGLAMLAGSVGLMGPGFGVAIGAVTAGMFTWMLGLIALHLFTKKGRVYRARQLEANQEPTS